MINEIMDDVKKAYIKDIENELSKACRCTVPESIILSALANMLVRRCQNAGVDKKRFTKLMNEGWDYHSSKE